MCVDKSRYWGKLRYAYRVVEEVDENKGREKETYKLSYN